MSGFSTGALVGLDVGDGVSGSGCCWVEVGAFVDVFVGEALGAIESFVGDVVSDVVVGDIVGAFVSAFVGVSVGAIEAFVGDAVIAVVGDVVGE